MTAPWRAYQEDVANFFRSLGLAASTDCRVQGVRTSHNVDVCVCSNHVGFDVTWLVECKYWKDAVTKLHVIALRQIVSDCGADRGILLSESGFQRGAIEAASLTNVQVTSLEGLRDSSEKEVWSMRLHDLNDRLLICSDKYWDIPKPQRIEHGLRCWR